MMKHVWLHLFACMLAAGPAAAQQVALRSGNWDMLRGDGNCAARLSEGAETLTVSQLGDGSRSVTLSGPQFRALSEKPLRLQITVTQSTGYQKTRDLRFDVITQPAPQGLLVDAKAGLMAVIWDAAEVSVLAAGARVPLARFTPGTNYAAEELRRCREESERMDRGSGKPEDTSGELLVPVNQIVTSEDYPKAALQNEWVGRSTVKLTVSAQGLVSGCTTLASSGHAILDQKACILFSHRARFSPARDAAGAPTEASYVAPVTWMIP